MKTGIGSKTIFSHIGELLFELKKETDDLGEDIDVLWENTLEEKDGVPANKAVEDFINSLNKLKKDKDELKEASPSDKLSHEDLTDALTNYERKLNALHGFHTDISAKLETEASARRLPPEFLQKMDLYIAKPFERFNNLRNNLEILLHKTNTVLTGDCIEELAGLCKKLENAVSDLDVKLTGEKTIISDKTSILYKHLEELQKAIKRTPIACKIIKGLSTDPSKWLDPVEASKQLRQFEALKERAEQECAQLGDTLAGIDRDLVDRVNLQGFLNLLIELNQKGLDCLRKISIAKEREAKRDPKTKALQDIAEDVGNIAASVKTSVSPSLKKIAEVAEEKRKKIESNSQALEDIAGEVKSISSIGLPEASAGAGPLPVFDPDGQVSAKMASILGVDLRAQAANKPELIAFAKTMKTLLGRSITKIKRDGVTVFEVQRQGAAPIDVAPTGQVRGMQATFYQRAGTIREAVKELQNSLVCQLLEGDEEEIDSLKADINAAVGDIVSEIGREGGALSDRGDILFDSLKEDLPNLRKVLGIGADLSAQKEMDIAEREQNESNFWLLNKYLRDTGVLHSIWDSYKSKIDTARGTLLSQLVRTIESIPATIQEVKTAMDSAGCGAADRRVKRINGKTTIEQMLSWIEVSASTEWPAKISGGDASRSEIRAINRASTKQVSLLGVLIYNIAKIVPTGASRVKNVLEKLKNALKVVQELTTDIIAP